MDFFSALPELCLSEILTRTSTRDVCRSSAITKGFKSVADSDSVWDKLLPSDHLEIVSRAVSPVPPFSTKKQLYFRLADSHIVLDGGRLSFAIDKATGKKCFMLGARELTFLWRTPPLNWVGVCIPRSKFSCSDFSYASGFSKYDMRLAVCWKGRIKVRLLSPRTTYVAYLVFKLTRRWYQFGSLPARASVIFVGEIRDEDEVEHPYRDFFKDLTDIVCLNPRQSGFEVTAPNARLPQKRMDKWMEIEMGEFYNGQGDSSEVKMQLGEVQESKWKSDIIVKGIEIRPKVGS